MKRLSEGKDSSKYIFPQCAFGANAIREMVMGHMRERRQSFKDTAIQRGGTLGYISNTNSACFIAISEQRENY